MRFALSTIAACAVLVTGCDQSFASYDRMAPAEEPAPPPEPNAAEAPPEAPPPSRAARAATPSRWDWCATIVNPPVQRPADAPTKAECDARQANQLAEMKRKALADDADLADPAAIAPFAQRRNPNRERGSWMQQLTPTSSEACTFTEKPRSARPAGLKVLATSGNMDLLGQGNLLAHDHAIGFVEASWNAQRPVIASRKDMPDLWIEPLGQRTVLIIGANELRCVEWDGGG